jgi:predicted RNA-binding Zn-ribbon protein involved in translation (DUF1610 family)
MTVPLVRPVQDWYCPNCGKRDRTHEARPHTRMHTCPKLRFLTAPMLHAGVSAKVELHERDDYVGSEHVQLDPERKRPVQSIVTTRDRGQDAIVFAPTATAGGQSHH